MSDTDAPLYQYEGYVFKELHEQFPDKATELVGLIEERRSHGRCDVCGEPLPKASAGEPIVAAHIVGISICPACRARHTRTP